MKLVSLSSVKSFLEVTDGKNDSLINLIIQQVSKAIESYLGRNLTQAEYTEYFNGGKRYYYVKSYPLFKWQDISNITLSGSSVVSITLTSHGYSTGNKVKFKDIVGTTELNDNTYTITKVDANTFTLDSTNSSNFTAYSSGGSASIAPAVVVSDATGYDDKSEYYVWENSGLVEFVTPISTTLPRQVKITYTGGYAADSDGILQVPDDLKRACLMQVAFDFRRRRDLGVSAISMPDGSLSVQNPTSLLPEVVRILKLYRNKSMAD